MSAIPPLVMVMAAEPIPRIIPLVARSILDPLIARATSLVLTMAAVLPLPLPSMAAAMVAGAQRAEALPLAALSLLQLGEELPLGLSLLTLAMLTMALAWVPSCRTLIREKPIIQVQWAVVLTKTAMLEKSVGMTRKLFLSPAVVESNMFPRTIGLVEVALLGHLLILTALLQLENLLLEGPLRTPVIQLRTTWVALTLDTFLGVRPTCLTSCFKVTPWTVLWTSNRPDPLEDTSPPKEQEEYSPPAVNHPASP